MITTLQVIINLLQSKYQTVDNQNNGYSIRIPLIGFSLLNYNMALNSLLSRSLLGS